MMSVMPLRTSICASASFLLRSELVFRKIDGLQAGNSKDYGLWSIFRVMKVDEKKEKLHSTG